MKIKLDHITNSSSMCYILDKRLLTDADLELIEKNRFLRKPIYLGVGRGSVYGEGEAVKNFLEWLKENDVLEWLKENDVEWIEKYGDSWANPQTEWLQNWLYIIGVDNAIFIRASDEEMGGRVEHSRLISEKAVAEMEYH